MLGARGASAAGSATGGPAEGVGSPAAGVAGDAASTPPGGAASAPALGAVAGSDRPGEPAASEVAAASCAAGGEGLLGPGDTLRGSENDAVLPLRRS